jgi:hypothetical protein
VRHVARFIARLVLELAWLGGLAGGVLLLLQSKSQQASAEGTSARWLPLVCGACVLVSSIAARFGLRSFLRRLGLQARGTDLGFALREHTLTSRPMEMRR